METIKCPGCSATVLIEERDKGIGPFLAICGKCDTTIDLRSAQLNYDKIPGAPKEPESGPDEAIPAETPEQDEAVTEDQEALHMRDRVMGWDVLQSKISPQYQREIAEKLNSLIDNIKQRGEIESELIFAIKNSLNRTNNIETKGGQ